MELTKRPSLTARLKTGVVLRLAGSAGTVAALVAIVEAGRKWY